MYIFTYVVLEIVISIVRLEKNRTSVDFILRMKYFLFVI